MSGYEDQYDRAAGTEAAEPLNVQIMKWEKDGDRVVGRFVLKDELPNAKFDNQVARYFVETDHGLVSCVLGGAADKELEGKLEPGMLVAFTFRGKKALDGGREVNMFQLDAFKESDPDVEAKPETEDTRPVQEDHGEPNGDC